MPAPKFTLALTGSAPNLLASKSDLEAGINAGFEELWGEVGHGRVFSTNNNTPSGLSVPEGTMVIEARGGLQRYTPATAPADGLETATLKKDAAGKWWTLAGDIRAAGQVPIPLVNVTGTNNITADLAAQFAWVPVTWGTLVDAQVPATVDNPLLTVAGVGPYPAVDANGLPLPRGWWAAGRRLVLKLFAAAGGQWRVTSGLGVTISEVVSLSGQVKAAQGTLGEFVQALNDPRQSVRLRMIGDSITWGANATGTGPSDPRTGQLTDPRASLDAPSYANLFRKFLAGAYFAPAISEQGPGWARYRTRQWMAIALDANNWAVRLTASGATSPRVTRAGGSLGTSLDLMAGTELHTDIVADNLTVRFARLGQPGAIGRILVDGVQVGSDIDLNGAAAFGHEVSITFPYGAHKVVLRTVGGATDRWRIEGVSTNRLLQFANDGINGRNVDHWLPGNGLLTGALVQDHEWVFINLGTNSRVISGAVNDPVKITTGLVSIGQFLQSSGKKVILLTPNLATGDKEVEGNPATYAFGQRDVRRAIQEAARQLGVSCIDLFGPTYLAHQEGKVVLDDNLHPNDLGFSIMAAEIRRAIADAERVLR